MTLLAVLAQEVVDEDPLPTPSMWPLGVLATVLVLTLALVFVTCTYAAFAELWHEEREIRQIERELGRR